MLISGVRYTNEIKSNGLVDRTYSDRIGFAINELYQAHNVFDLMIISDLNKLIRLPKLSTGSLSLFYQPCIFSRFDWFYDLSRMNSNVIED